VAPAIPVAVPATAATTAPTSAAVLPSTPATAAAPTLFGPVAALAVDRTVPTRFERHRCGLATTGTNHGCARAHAGAGAPTRAVTAAIMLRMGRSMAPTAATGALFCLAAWLAAAGRGVAAFLEKLLFTSSEDKFLTAVATG
jgi:hypothetical protein